MGLSVELFLIFLCTKHNKAPFGDVNAQKLAGSANQTVLSFSHEAQSALVQASKGGGT